MPAKHVRGSGEQLLLPFGDLGGMDTELLGQFGQRLVAFDGGQRHLRLEGRSMIPSRSFHCLAPLVGHLAVALVKPGYHLPHCPNFRSPLLQHSGAIDDATSIQAGKMLGATHIMLGRVRLLAGTKTYLMSFSLRVIDLKTASVLGVVVDDNVH